MFQTALVLTDLSEVSSHMIACLGGIRQMGVSRVVLVHTLNTRHSNVLYQQLLALSADKMQEQKLLLEQGGFDVELTTPMGVPYYEVNDLAARRAASLIVVYSTAETLLGDVFAGAVTYEVANQSTLPVLVMKARMSEAQCEVICPNLMVRLLYPTDFSETAQRAFETVEQLVRAGCNTVTLAHVQDRSRIDPYLTGG